MYSEKKLEELFKSEEFKKEVANLKTAEELRAAFAKHGVEMTEEEVVNLCGQIAKQVSEGENGELTEESLENVSGGIAPWLIGLGVVCIGSVALGIWNGYNDAKKGK